MSVKCSIIGFAETGTARILFYNTEAPVTHLRPVRQSQQLMDNGCLALRGQMFLYLLQMGDTDCFKIGVSDNVGSRIRELQTGNPYLLRVVARSNMDREVLTNNAALTIEKTLHRIFADVKLMGEWFCLNQKDVDSVKKAFNTLETGSRDDILMLKESLLNIANKHNACPPINYRHMPNVYAEPLAESRNE